VQQEHDIDLFHVHYALPHAVSAYLAREMAKGGLRFITTLHGTDITIVGADQAYMLPTKFAINQSNAVTAVSEFLARETCEVFGIEQTIHVVPNFVDTRRYVPSKAGAWYERGGEERVIAHVSNFRPVKRVANVVRAFAHICEKVPSRLLLVGDGPDREHALAVASDLGCRDRVEHLGNTQAIEQVLTRADLFLMASETESFGLSILEAMSCGVPCVSTDVGGVREVMGDTGALTRLGHTKEMGDAALSFLMSEEKHRAASAAARTRAIEHFDEAMVVERYFEIYRKVLAES
jgi:L-malate glycosyltransferase